MTRVCFLTMSHSLRTTEYRSWLQEIPWQLFATLTFAWRVSDAQASRVFTAFVDSMERSLRCPITYIRGEEVRFAAGTKSSAPRHFHVLLTAGRHLDARWVAQQWTALAG